MRKLDEMDASMGDTSLMAKSPQLAADGHPQQPVAMASSLPRHLNDAKNAGNSRLSRHTDAATSCEEILMTVHTNKGASLNTAVCFYRKRPYTFSFMQEKWTNLLKNFREYN